MTQPPCANVRGRTSAGMATLADLYRACIAPSEGPGRMRHDCHYLHQLEEWVHLAADIDVDIVTGSQMLSVFRMSYNELRRRGFLWKDAEDVAEQSRAEERERDKAQVFSTFEIVESILLHLPLRQVFVMRRANRAFDDVVDC